MAIKIENHAEAKLPRQTVEYVNNILNALPKEHTRGIERIRLVDVITDPRLTLTQRDKLPGLYHPRQGAQAAWIEVALGALLPPAQPIHKRLVPRLSLKSNLAAVIISLVGQHYYLTLRHSIKKGQLEPAIKAYTEKNLRLWSERQHSFRTRLFKPLQPTFERWARALQRRVTEERKRRV